DQTHKTYPDGWVAPVLKSSWTPNHSQNLKIFANELKFRDGGYVWGVPGQSKAIVIGQDIPGYEAYIKFSMWESNSIEASYRIPIVAKELFKFYFEEDANRVFNYFNTNDIPDKFTANGRTVETEWEDTQGRLYLKIGEKYQPSTGGKVYPDGWVAPVLKSSWTPNHSQNLKIFANELGFERGGYVFSVPGQPSTIIVGNDIPGYEAYIKFSMWENSDIKASYRVPIVAKELFKFYFEGDADKVFNYFNTNNIPDKFTANGRTVETEWSDTEGRLYLEIGKK
ncbi:hypothetical protein ACFSUL_07705, partial [Bacillus seohaeanensis]